MQELMTMKTPKPSLWSRAFDHDIISSSIKEEDRELHFYDFPGHAINYGWHLLGAPLYCPLELAAPDDIEEPAYCAYYLWFLARTL